MVKNTFEGAENSNAIPSQTEKLDEKFLEAIAEHCKAYYNSDARKKFPKANLPENQELTLLLEIIRQTNDINAKNAKGNTLLMLVLYTNESALLELLLSHPQIDINAQNDRGLTALGTVCAKGVNMEPMLKPFLVHPQLEVDTALDMARRYDGHFGDYAEIIKFLEAKQNEIQEGSRIPRETSTLVTEMGATVANVLEGTTKPIGFLVTDSRTTPTIDDPRWSSEKPATAEMREDSLECSLEDEAFHIDSIEWNVVKLQDAKGNLLDTKVNSEGDICELPNGVQLFTPNAMARELLSSGRVQDMMTREQAQWLMKNTPNIPEGCEFSGFIDSKGRLLFDGENACYWIGDVTEKGNQQALFYIKVEEEMRAYMDEVIIGDYDTKSMMQVRLLKRKTT